MKSNLYTIIIIKTKMDFLYKIISKQVAICVRLNSIKEDENPFKIIENG